MSKGPPTGSLEREKRDEGLARSRVGCDGGYRSVRLKASGVTKSLKADWRLVAAAQAMRSKEFVDEFDAAAAVGKTIKQRREVEHWSDKLEELERREQPAAPAAPAAPIAVPAAPTATTASANLDEDCVDAPLTPSLVSRMQSLWQVDAAAPLRDSMHLRPAWIAEAAPDLSNVESSQLQMTPQGNHATRSLRGEFNSPGSGREKSVNSQESAVHPLPQIRIQ